MRRRALVTGGAGFIGSHLVERLLNEGHEVTVIDNFSTGGPRNLTHLADYETLSVIRADITDTEMIRSHFEGVEWVFHLAAIAEIVPSIQDPMSYVRVNVEGTANVIDAARRAGVDRLIYAASSSCYGVPDQFPTPETAEIRPEYPYALTKNLGEQLVMHWEKIYQIPSVSLRLFNVYGPRSRTSGTYGAVFGVFLAQKLAGKNFTVVGDGTQTRDFTFVTDVVDAFVRAAKSDRSGEVFNVGTGNPRSVNELVALLRGEKVHIPKRPGEPDCTSAANERIRDAFGWQPRVSFEQGVQVLLENIDYWREAPVWDEASIAEATQDWFACLGPPKA